MLFYCKPYCKVDYDKKAYNSTISRPTFLNNNKEREIFLNGEIKNLEKVGGSGGKAPRQIKKTMVCLKCLSVDD